MKKLSLIILSLILAVSLVACGGSDVTSSDANTINGYPVIKEATLKPSDGTLLANKPDYMVTDFIPCKGFCSYTVTVNLNYPVNGGVNTRCFVYNENHELVLTAFDEKRTEQKEYSYTFSTPLSASYLRFQLGINDTELTITENGTFDSGAVYKSNSFIQGMCASEDFLFVSYSKSKGGDKNDYQIQKLNRKTGTIIATSTEYFNHANGMTYNKNTNEVIVCAFNGNTGSTETTCDDDFSLYVVDADTLALKRTVNLKDAVLSVCADSTGIGGVTYSAEYDEYYAFTRYPERYIITFNGDFTLKDSVYLYHYDDKGGTAGDICFDGTYFYLATWRNDIDQLCNDVAIYTKDGTLVDTYDVNGIAHIESLDKVGDTFYMAFIADLGKPSARAEVYIIPTFNGDITLP